MKDNPQKARGGEKPPEAFDPIDAALRQIFDNVSDEDVPDDFSALVAQFAQQRQKSGDAR